MYIEGGPRQWLSDDFYGLKVIRIFKRMIGRIKKKEDFWGIMILGVLGERKREVWERMLIYGWYDVGCYDFVMIVS